MLIEKISKPYWNSGNKDALAVIMPKVIREALEVDSESYIKWSMTLDKDGQLVVTVNKV